MFLVLRNSSATGNRAPLGDTSGYGYLSGSSREIWYSGDPAQIRNGETWLNGQAVTGTTEKYPDATGPLAVVTSIATAPVASGYLGQSSGSYFWQGDIAEVLVYAPVLSATDRRAIEDYLALKYGAYAVKTAPPVITPGGGVFDVSTTVQMTSTNVGAAIRYTVDGTDPGTSASAIDYSGPFLLHESATVKAVAVAPGLPASDVAWARLTRSDEFSPATPSGLLVWLASDQGLDWASPFVDVWRDQSGNGNDAVQTSGASLPALVTDESSGMPMLHFDGTNDFLSLKTRVTNGQTVFLVVRNSSTTGYRAPLGDTSGYAYMSGSSREIWYGGDAAQIRSGETWLNGQAVTGTTTTYPDAAGPLAVVTSIATAPAASSYLGQSSGTYYWQGDIAEVVIYDRALTGEERYQVEQYLLRKYASVDGLLPSSPVFTPNGGLLAGPTMVSLSTATPGAAIYYTLDGSDPTPATATLYDTPFMLSATTTVKAKAYMGGVASVTAVAGFIESSDFNPMSVSGLQVWLRGDAGVPRSGAYLDLWRDQSGNGNDAAQTSGASLPALVTDASSGMPMLHFDGTNDFLSLKTRITNGQTVFLVVRNSSTTGTGRLWATRAATAT